MTAEPVPLDEQFPEWGDSRYVRLVLEGELRLADALRHLYVLLPVLDDAKHYWVAPDEVDKLLRAGEGWLPDHPEQKLITSRYLSRRWSLTRQAMERLELVRLAEADDSEVEEIDNAVDETTDTEEKPVPLAVQRRDGDPRRAAAAGARPGARPRLRPGPVGAGAAQGRAVHRDRRRRRVDARADHRLAAAASWTGWASGRPPASSCSRARSPTPTSG